MIVRILCLIVVGVLLSPNISDAFKIGYEDIANLLKQADYVALVRIDSGETLFSEDKLCGVKYKGKVLDQIKGIFKDEPLEWCTAAYSNNYGLEIGIPYILFLTKPGRGDPFHPDTAYHDDMAELHRVCSSALQGNRVIHSGYGALKVRLDHPVRPLDELKGTVTVPNFVISLPGTLKSEEEHPGPLRYVRVDLKDLVSCLKSEHGRRP
jgi:hypothetical protein